MGVAPISATRPRRRARLRSAPPPAPSARRAPSSAVGAARRAASAAAPRSAEAPVRAKLSQASCMCSDRACAAGDSAGDGAELRGVEGAEHERQLERVHRALRLAGRRALPRELIDEHLRRMRRVELGQLERGRAEHVVGRDGEPRLGRRGIVAARGRSPAIDLRDALAVGPAIGARRREQRIAPSDQARRVQVVERRIEETVELHLLEVRADDEGHATRGARGDRREGIGGDHSPSATGENGGTTVRPATAFWAATRSSRRHVAQHMRACRARYPVPSGSGAPTRAPPRAGASG